MKKIDLQLARAVEALLKSHGLENKAREKPNKKAVKGKEVEK